MSFVIEQFKNQIYVSEGAQQMLHALLHGPSNVTVQVGSGDSSVEIEKFYGALSFCPIRVTMDLGSCEWVIERSCGPEGEWREWCRVPGQLEEDAPK